MPFTPKTLDDRTFQRLFDEAKRRIPAYLPEWTDHGESDPGITLLQLFAWLTETAIFRLDQVPDERMFVSFLNLLGVSPAPARPAEAVIEVAMVPGAAPMTLAPQQLRLKAPGAGAETIPFEADRPVPLVGATLGAVLVDDGVSPARLDATPMNERGDAPYAPFGATRDAGGALYLGLDVPPGRALVGAGARAELQIFARCEEPAAQLRYASTSLEKRVVPLDGDVIWEGRTEGHTWAPLELVADETRGLRRSGLLRVVLTDRLRPATEAGDAGAVSRFWIRAVAAAARPPEAPSVRAVSINAARVRQLRTYLREPLFPGSDGTPRQTRAVRHPPILLDPDDPPRLEVNEPTSDAGALAFRAWTWVDDLATREASGQIAPEGHPLRVFRVSDDRARVEFGDGIEGMIPPRGPDNLRLTYRSGGGAAGNVAAGQISLDASIPGVRGVVQREDASGGSDEESVEDARLRAPGRIRALERAVTAADFEVIARERANVARASAINRYHPLYPGAKVTGAVTLVVIPRHRADDPAPLPTQAFLDEVALAVEPCRVLTTELFVVAPRYRRVVVDVEVEVRHDADAPAIRAAVAAELRRYFDPIVGGRDGDGWPLGEPIVHGELIDVLGGVDRVIAVLGLSIALDGVTAPRCGDVTLGSPLDLLASGLHRVRVSAPRPRR
ncbi:hypothetical protein BE21_04625 [Sorangium cellulosum]|uniref:Uncharacterized protein n=1 Tax=Sorangium cellulosum TaxID=56 RepID=A0A150TFN7_SORCE|nr:hypothetical protein BE21_04625 [Sorangium cellulosum]